MMEILEAAGKGISCQASWATNTHRAGRVAVIALRDDKHLVRT